MAAAFAGLAIAASAAIVGDAHASADLNPSLGVQPAEADRPRHDVIDGRFDVGGYELYLRCSGTGTPTVVMDASANEDSSTWTKVESSLARRTRVCVYDRAGLGQSEPGPVPRTSQTMVDDLTTLLHVAAVPGPYVLVGHSIAGFNVQVFAREDGGDTVVGVVLIDATPPDFIAVLDSLGVYIPPPSDTVENPEGQDFQASASQALAAGPFPPVPLAVLTHGSPGSYGPPLEDVWQELQAAQSQLSPDGHLIVARRSGHYIQNDQPRLVLRAIAQVVNQARHNAPRGHAITDN
jgi:thioesterase domain-containing protein